ncbi:BIC1-like protein [Tanacetum coccineum]
MESHQNPNLENNQNYNHYNVLPSQDLKMFHHQHNLKVSKDMDKNQEVFSLKNASEVTKKLPNSLSCSALGIEKDTTPPPMTPQDFMSIQRQQNLNVPNKPHEDDGSISKNAYEMTKKPNSTSCSSLKATEKDMTTQAQAPQEMVMDEESGRERLKKHRAEMAGQVWIPDIWGHEDLLKDWIDCTVFDSSLGNKNIMSARAALVQEGRSTLRIQNQC